MAQLPLQRGNDGQLRMAGYGPVTLQMQFEQIIGAGGQGTVFKGRIVGGHGALVLEVALKANQAAHDPLQMLHAEAELHAYAWLHLPYVLRPLGFLDAHDPSGTPAVLVVEIGVPLAQLLVEARATGQMDMTELKAVTRVVNQLLRFIIAGDERNFMHKDLKMDNIYVRNTHDLDLVQLAVGDFGGAQRGESKEDGKVVYRAGVYTWHQTSPRLAAHVYAGMSAEGNPAHIELDAQLILFNELFGWARIAFKALTDRSPPDIMYGPSPEDYASVPGLGHGAVMDAVHHLLSFALELLTTGNLDEIVDSNYIKNLPWFNWMPQALAGNVGG